MASNEANGYQEFEFPRHIHITPAANKVIVVGLNDYTTHNYFLASDSCTFLLDVYEKKRHNTDPLLTLLMQQDSLKCELPE